MELSREHLEALAFAERNLFHRDFCPYLDLKALLPINDSFSRGRFRELFTDFYQLRRGGLTEEFKDKYFEILFDPPQLDGRLDVRRIFEELCSVKNWQGSETLPLSFVSKLVGMHDESSPIYDIHVSRFLGVKPPGPTRPMALRIDWCLEFFGTATDDYVRWAKQEDVATILQSLKQRDIALTKCHDVRLLDFLIWKVGSKQLLQ